MFASDYSPELVQQITDTARKTKIDYEVMRTKVMNKISEFLLKTDKAFTAKELSKQFGLSARVISRLARDYGFRASTRWETQRFAPLNNYNEPDLDNIKTIRHRVKEYYIPNDKYSCYRY